MNATVETPHPSQAEHLRAEYGEEWEIYRELIAGPHHGDWIAERIDGAERLTASTVEALAGQLREAAER